MAAAAIDADTDGSTPWVDGLTIGAVLRATARRYPDDDAVVFPALGYRRSWKDLDAEVDQVAEALLAAGYRRGVDDRQKQLGLTRAQSPPPCAIRQCRSPARLDQTTAPCQPRKSLCRVRFSLFSKCLAASQFLASRAETA